MALGSSSKASDRGAFCPPPRSCTNSTRLSLVSSSIGSQASSVPSSRKTNTIRSASLIGSTASGTRERPSRSAAMPQKRVFGKKNIPSYEHTFQVPFRLETEIYGRLGITREKDLGFIELFHLGKGRDDHYSGAEAGKFELIEPHRIPVTHHPVSGERMDERTKQVPQASLDEVGPLLNMDMAKTAPSGCVIKFPAHLRERFVGKAGISTWNSEPKKPRCHAHPTNLNSICEQTTEQKLPQQRKRATKHVHLKKDNVRVVLDPMKITRDQCEMRGQVEHPAGDGAGISSLEQAAHIRLKASGALVGGEAGKPVNKGADYNVHKLNFQRQRVAGMNTFETEMNQLIFGRPLSTSCKHTSKVTSKRGRPRC